MYKKQEKNENSKVTEVVKILSDVYIRAVSIILLSDDTDEGKISQIFALDPPQLRTKHAHYIIDVVDLQVLSENKGDLYKVVNSLHQCVIAAGQGNDFDGKYKVRAYYADKLYDRLSVDFNIKITVNLK